MTPLHGPSIVGDLEKQTTITHWNFAISQSTKGWFLMIAKIHLRKTLQLVVLVFNFLLLNHSKKKRKEPEKKCRGKFHFRWGNTNLKYQMKRRRKLFNRWEGCSGKRTDTFYRRTDRVRLGLMLKNWSLWNVALKPGSPSGKRLEWRQLSKKVLYPPPYCFD